MERHRTSDPGPADIPASRRAEGPRLDLQATITEADLFEFNRVWSRSSGEEGRSIWGACAWSLAPIAGGAAILTLGDPLLGGALLALGVVLAVAAGPYYRYALRRSVARQTEGHNPVLMGPRRIVIDSTGIFEGGRYDRMRVAWPGIVELARGPEALYVFYGSQQAVIVPKRAFGSVAEFDRAVGVVERYAGRRVNE